MTILFSAACTGYTEDETVVRAEKVEIFADGHDAVAFTVDFAGQDVTGQAVVTNLTTGEVVEGNRFSTETPGTYRFTATYDGVDALPVTVTARKAELSLSTEYRADGDTKTFTFRALYGTLDVSLDDGLAIYENSGVALDRDADGYYRATTTGDEKRTFSGQWNGHSSAPITIGPVRFYKRVGILDFTGTWCSNCSDMAEYLGGAAMGYPDRMVMLAVHVNDKLAVSNANTLTTMFKANLLPAAVIDFGSPITGANTSASDMERRIREIVAANPARCGLAVSTTVENGSVAVGVTLLSGETMDYGIAVALVEDGITGYPQMMPDGTTQADYVHDHTLRGFYQENVEGVKVGQVAAGSQVEKEFEFDLKGYDADRCSIVVFATSERNGKTVLLNAAECAVGKSIDVQYESDL